MNRSTCLTALGLGVVLSTQVLAATLTVAVVDREGQPVPDAVVVVVPAQRGAQPPVLPKTASIVQEKMRFLPAVTVVPVGTKITFSNNDSFDHHVRGTPAAMMSQTSASAGGFDLRLDARRGTAPAQSADIVVAKAGPIQLGCHLHGSMRGYLFVADSPWTAKTGADGQVQIDDLPDGAARVQVWHAEQVVELPAVSVVVGAAPTLANVALQIVPRRRRS